MRASALLVVALFTVGLFAGCVGSSGASGAPRATSGPVGAAGPAEFNETTGGIEGSVTDAELTPVPGAIVGIPAGPGFAGLQTTTDASGLYALSHVPPGK